MCSPDFELRNEVLGNGAWNKKSIVIGINTIIRIITDSYTFLGSLYLYHIKYFYGNVQLIKNGNKSLRKFPSNAFLLHLRTISAILGNNQMQTRMNTKE